MHKSTVTRIIIIITKLLKWHQESHQCTGWHTPLLPWTLVYFQINTYTQFCSWNSHQLRKCVLICNKRTIYPCLSNVRWEQQLPAVPENDWAFKKINFILWPVSEDLHLQREGTSTGRSQMAAMKKNMNKNIDILPSLGENSWPISDFLIITHIDCWDGSVLLWGNLKKKKNSTIWSLVMFCFSSYSWQFLNTKY